MLPCAESRRCLRNCTVVSAMLFKRIGQPLDLLVEIPDRLFQVFDEIALVAGTPHILDGVTEVETHVLGYIDAFDCPSAFAFRRNRLIMGRVINHICNFLKHILHLIQ